jgi:hypothetical protein
MGSALEYAYDFIRSLPYNKNEVILISDGLPYGNESYNPIESIKNMAAAKIKVSTINIVNQNGADLMKELASIGGGYYYYINEVKDVENLVLNEVLNSLTETILDKESDVSITSKKNDLVEGIESLPAVGGLYNNFTKSSATVVLKATYVDITNYSYDVPLYSYWNYGNGIVSSFASTISGKWAENWLKSNDAKKVLSNIASVNQPDVRIDSAFIVTTECLGTVTKIIVDAPTLNHNSKIKVNVKYPDNNVVEKELVFDSENYIVKLPTELIGEYTINLSYNLGQLVYEANSTFNVSYLPEYDSFTIYEASDLYYMVSMNGSVSEDGHLVLVNDNSNVQKYILDFTAPFMVICVILFVVDIMVRKLGWADIKSLLGLFKKKEGKKAGRNKRKEETTAWTT